MIFRRSCMTVLVVAVIVVVGLGGCASDGAAPEAGASADGDARDEAATYESIGYDPVVYELANVVASSLARSPIEDRESLRWLLELRPAVRSALINELPDQPDAEGGSGAVEALIFLLAHDPIANFRSRSASGLSPTDSPAARAALIAALEDDDANVRLFACQSLMWAEDASVAKHVMALLDDPSADTRRVAVRVLGELGARAALPRIRELYAGIDPSSSRATHFAGAFARLGDEAMALRAIEPLLDHKNWNVRHMAVSHVEHVQSRKVVPMLIDALADEMRLELEENVNHSFELPTRVMENICRLLDERTGESFGVDPRRWMAWWGNHSEAYGVPAAQAQPPDGYRALYDRYMLAIETGLDPAYEPLQANAHLKARYIEQDETVSSKQWSRVSQGLRIRLFAPPNISVRSDMRRESNSSDDRVRLLLALHNTTDEPLIMPMPRFAREMDVENARVIQQLDTERRDGMSQRRWSHDGETAMLAPHQVTLWAIDLQRPRRDRMSREASSFPAHTERIDMPSRVLHGRHAMTLTIDLTDEDQQQASANDESPAEWHGKLTTPPEVVEFGAVLKQ